MAVAIRSNTVINTLATPENFSKRTPRIVYTQSKVREIKEPPRSSCHQEYKLR